MLRSVERAFKDLITSFLRFLFRSNSPTDISSTSFQAILVIRQHNQLGDMLCVVPLLRALRGRFANATISLLTSPVNHDVMLYNRYINEVINYDKSHFKGLFGYSPTRIVSFMKSLRRKHFDLVLVPSTVSISFTSNLLAFFSGAPVRIGAESIDGVSNPSSFFFTHPVELDWRSTTNRHQTLRNLDIAQPLGISSTELGIEMTLTEAERKEVNLLLFNEKGPDRSIISFHPGAGKAANRWPAPRFAAVANALSREYSATILITSGPMDGGAVSDMIAHMNSRFEILQDKPIRTIALMLSRASLVISNDTGIMHVAAAAGTPVLSLFGPTDPHQWAPIGDMHRFIRGNDGTMESITVEQVLTTARVMLGPARKG